MARPGTLSSVRTLFNIGKKFVDILDDLWSTLRGILPVHVIQAVTPFILGSVGFITHIGEGIQGARAAYRAYKNEKIGQRKTRIVSSVLIFMLAGAGAGLAISLLASALGAAVSGATLVLAPVLIPGFLTAIYGLSLWRRSYVFHRAKEEEAKAKAEYEATLSQEADPSVTTAESRKAKKRKYEKWREKRLRAERKLAFNVVEVFASSLVLTSTILGTAAIVGASVATMGVLPLSLLIVGVVAGVGCKLFEYVDEKHGFSLTRRLRNWFSEKFEKKKTSDAPRLEKAKDQAVDLASVKTSLNLHKRLAEENLITLVPVQKKKTALPPLSPGAHSGNPKTLIENEEQETPVVLSPSGGDAVSSAQVLPQSPLSLPDNHKSLEDSGAVQEPKTSLLPACCI